MKQKGHGSFIENLLRGSKRLSVTFALCISIMISACGNNAAAIQQPDNAQDASEKLEVPELEAEDLAIFMDYDEAKGGVTLMSVDNGRSYTVSVNNLTVFEDNYGKVSVPELFEMGMIVNADLSVHSRTLKSLRQDPDAFVRRDVTDFSMNINRGVFSLSDGTNLRITDKTVIIKDEKVVKPTDITDSDTLLIRGRDHDLYSIVIMSGYGHLRIKGAEYFVGGWVQIAGMFKPVSDDMLLDVPEGEYDMVITYKGQGGIKHVTVKRGRETSVNVSDLKGDLIKTGEIMFNIRPLDAVPTVRIDGEIVDYLEPVELEYGVYQLEVSAAGYATIKERISVGADFANVEIVLSEEDESTDSSSSSSSSRTVSGGDLPTNLTGSSSSTTSSSSSGSSTSSSSVTSSSSSTYESTIVHGSRIYIDAPETAEVYFDGIYKGIVPCSFVKETGTHVITLRKDGYETRTFTITIDNNSENETYSFSELQEQ